MGVSPMLSVNLAKDKRATLAISYQKNSPDVVTWIGRLMPDGMMEAKIFANYTGIKADNKTMYRIPINMLTGNTNSTHVIFVISGKKLALYMVNELNVNDRLVSIEWSTPENNSEVMEEKWTHCASGTKATSLFEKVQNKGDDPNCKLS